MESNSLHTLAAQTIALLVPYLAATGKAVAARVGDEIGGQFRTAITNVYACVKKKFATNPRAKDDLSRLEQEPQSHGRQAVVNELLSRFIAEDGQFATELGKMVKAAQPTRTDTIIQTVNVSGGSVADIKQIGKIEGRD